MVGGHSPLASSLPETALKQRTSVPSQGEKINSARGTGEGRYHVISGNDKAGGAQARTLQTPWYAAFVAILKRNETMRPEGLRQSDRVSFRMPVEASWTGNGGLEIKQSAETLLVSRNG